MCCLALTAGLIGPRVALLIWWLVDTDRVDAAFGSWVWPVLGVIFLPWTTLAYLVVWSPIVGVDNWEWIIVALGVTLDVATYSSRMAASRYQSARSYQGPDLLAVAPAVDQLAPVVEIVTKLKQGYPPADPSWPLAKNGSSVTARSSTRLKARVQAQFDAVG